MANQDGAGEANVLQRQRVAYNQDPARTVMLESIRALLLERQGQAEKKEDPTPVCITESQKDLLDRQKNEIIRISQLPETVSDFPEGYPGLLKVLAEKSAACSHAFEDFMRDVYAALSDVQKAKMRNIYDGLVETTGFLELSVSRNPAALRRLVVGRAPANHDPATLKLLAELEKDVAQERLFSN
eukprot:TRINITY_DN40209_c0_g1_i1.p1 TRINITY_DN40209_c0_g1~~TRINITY_DN40209_c0_g1_i1.p1  ORF type:complete len:185 (+),score=31.40 TRINITY_DN40209_c0_g1_i1:101-655(+)